MKAGAKLPDPFPTVLNELDHVKDCNVISKLDLNMSNGSATAKVVAR
jgi:hypothetical protein